MCIPSPAFMAWRSDAALWLLARGEPNEARELVNEENCAWLVWSGHGGRGDRPSGSRAVEGGEDGLERLRESEQVLDGSGARLEHARSLIDYGAALRRAGERRAAREPPEERSGDRP